MSGAIPSSPTSLQTVIPAYLYAEYSDDDDLQGFIAALNGMTQQYVDWFNATPLGVYTAPGIAGALLDWIGQGVYGIARPVLSTLSTTIIAGYNALPYNTIAYDALAYSASGSSQIATDDIYKRVLTWHLYRGDGMQMSIPWLKRRIARFLNGANGSDAAVLNAPPSIVIQPLSAPAAPASNLAFQMGAAQTTTTGGSPTIASSGTITPTGGTETTSGAQPSLSGLATTTFYVMLTYVTPIGETLPSAESVVTIQSGSPLTISSPGAASGATGYNVYVSTTSGSETKQNTTPIAFGTAWTEPTTGLVNGSAPPTSNTSNTPSNFLVTLPNTSAAQIFKQCIANGVLALPFQNTFTITVG